MDDMQLVLNELKEIKGLVIELKKDIIEKDKRISELERIVDIKPVEELRDSEELSAINSGDPEVCYNYALKHPDADILALGETVIKSGNLKYNHLFMKNINGCAFQKHLQVILDSENPEYCYYAALLKVGKETADLIRKMLVKSKSVEYCYEFANDIRYIYDVEDENDYDFLDVSDLEKVIVDNLDIKYSYMFAKNVDNANIEALEKIILDLATITDIETVFNFGVDVKGAHLNKCREKIVELYNQADNKQQKEITKEIGECEKNKIRCLFRSSFADNVVIE